MRQRLAKEGGFEDLEIHITDEHFKTVSVIQIDTSAGRLEFGAGEVFYRGGVTEATAQKVGSYLLAKGWFETPAAVQLRMEAGQHQLRFVILEDYWDDPKVAGTLRQLGRDLREEVGVESLEVHIGDAFFNTVKVIEDEPSG